MALISQAQDKRQVIKVHMIILGICSNILCRLVEQVAIQQADRPLGQALKPLMSQREDITALMMETSMNYYIGMVRHKALF